jgi:hypothetical protein
MAVATIPLRAIPLTQSASRSALVTLIDLIGSSEGSMSDSGKTGVIYRYMA